MSAKETRLTELLQLPWSRQVAADEDGVFVASVPELEGCFAEGDSAAEALASLEQVIKEWLEIALDDEVQIASPRRLRDADYSGRFSVRVPRSLHRELSEWALEEEISLNQLISTVLARAIAQRPIAGAYTGDSIQDAYEQIAAAAVMGGAESIGALKSIGAYLRQAGITNLACVLFAFAAERIAMIEGAEATSRELGITAALARREGKSLLAEALWRLSLHHDPHNLRTLSGLGQLLHHSGRYEEAVQYLEPAAQVDNHALLFLGWSQLVQGAKLEDNPLAQRGAQSVINALERWAMNNADRNERGTWIRQVRRLASFGSTYRNDAISLVDFANRHAGWSPLSYDEILLPDDGIEDNEPGQAIA